MTARREHDHGNLDPPVAELPAHLETVHLGQHHVEQHQVERFGARPLEPGASVAGVFDLVALASEAVGQRQHETGFIFDEEEASLGH